MDGCINSSLYKIKKRTQLTNLEKNVQSINVQNLERNIDRFSWYDNPTFGHKNRSINNIAHMM